MKLQLAAAFVLCAALSAQAADEVREVGVGVIAGDPIGGTAKLWFDDRVAADLGVGYSGNTVMWADLLVHSWTLLPQPEEGKLGVYAGAGPRLETARDAEFGLRTILGISWRLKREPIELFAEAGPLFRFTPTGGVGADGGIGLRIYLGR
jgi:hypothetical protein